MLEVEKSKNMNNYDIFYITTNEGKFIITFEGNLDLYWVYTPNENILNAPNEKEFTITKENYFIYQLFDSLYHEIKNNKNPYDKYNPERLVNKNTIDWHSDDFPYETASRVIIKKLKDSYKITFTKSKEDTLYVTYSVRFRNSGSRYSPHNQSFMKMYNSLINYRFNNDCHQIHMEEYLYEQKKLSLKRSKK